MKSVRNLAIYTLATLSNGRKNNLAHLYGSYKELELKKAGITDINAITADEAEKIRKNAYEDSVNLWFWMLFVWLTPLLTILHANYQFSPMNIISFAAFISGLYIYIRQFANTIDRYGDSYTKPIPQKSPMGWYLLKLLALFATNTYYVAILLVLFGILAPGTTPR